MSVAISPELEKLLDDKVASGEFESRQAIVETVLRTLLDGQASVRPPQLSAEEAVRRWDEFMAEVDRDPPSDAPPLSDEALSRESIYDDERHRI